MMETVKKETCKDKVEPALQNIIQDWTEAQKYYDIDEEKRYSPKDESLSDYEDFFDYVNNYGLCFDYVSPNTFDNQDVGYFRYQVCYGGPTQEFRIYTDYNKNIDRIEFWYLNWFDGSEVETDEDIIKQVLRDFIDCSQIEPSEVN
jgi:hypothetical protein